MDSTKKEKELWDRLATESERAYRAFEFYLALPPGERTVVAAYKAYTGNPEATKVSDTWTGWSRQYAWRERAAAYDEHMASIRREAYERGIQEEAERQARAVERTRYRMNHLMTMAYDEAVSWVEEGNLRENIRPQDFIQIVKLFIEVAQKFGVTEEPREADWSEEDDLAFDEIIKAIEAEERSDEEGCEEEKDV